MTGKRSVYLWINTLLVYIKIVKKKQFKIKLSNNYCVFEYIVLQDILQATVDYKDKLTGLIAELPSLEYVEINDWAGLGAVRYVPQQWQSSDQQLATDQDKQDLNRLNVRIVQQLRSIDAAFSLGKCKSILNKKQLVILQLWCKRVYLLFSR